MSSHANRSLADEQNQQFRNWVNDVMDWTTNPQNTNVLSTPGLSRTPALIQPPFSG
jgi:hypothetical protein